MAPPSFLDRLAPELRIDIYAHVFGTSNTIKPSGSTVSLGIDTSRIALSAHQTDAEEEVDCSILSTNKLISREAIQVLYRHRTVRATIPEFSELLQEKSFVANVQNVEIADCIDGCHRDDFHKILQKLQRLLRVRSVVILSDCLGIIDPEAPRLNSIQHWIQKIAGLGQTECVDVGRYQLRGKYRKTQVVNRKLITMWPSVQSTPAKYDALAEFETMIRKWIPPLEFNCRVAWTLQSSFRCWVGLHELAATMDISGELGRFGGFTHHHDDPLALAWATEYLSANIASFWAESDTDPGFLRTFTAHWAEADGGVNMIEHIIGQQEAALGGLANQDYIPDPIRNDRLIPCEVARALVEDRWMEALMDPTTTAELKPRELHQLTYICIAMDPPMGFQPADDEEYGNDLDDWSLALFKRYLRTSGFAKFPDVRDANLSSVRKAMKELLGMLISTDKRDPSLLEVFTDPPEDVDSELFRPLVWRWGHTFATVWARQQSA